MTLVKVCHITTVDVSLTALLLNQLRSLRGEGYEVVTISSPGPYVSTLEAEGIRHIPVPMTRRFTPLADLRSLWRLYRVMRKERFTLVHTHNPKPGLLGQLAARFAGVPLVVNTVHGFYFHDNMHRLARRFYIIIEKIAALCSDLILSQNLEDMETAIREGICSRERIKHLSNGIDLDRFDPSRVDLRDVARKRSELGLDASSPVVGFVGRLTRRKGFLHFLSAAKQVLEARPEAVFLIIGERDRDRADSLDAREAGRLGIEDRCLFLGNIPNEELPTFYRLMDVLVLPSPWEGIPRVVMEASAMGIPSVVTDVKGNREVVLHKQTGVLVPYGDVDALARGILWIDGDRDRALQLGRRGKSVAAERFDERRVFDLVRAEYNRLLQDKHLSPAALLNPRSVRRLDATTVEDSLRRPDYV